MTRFNPAISQADTLKGIDQLRRITNVQVTFHPMIQLTRLNNSGFTVNADLIKFVEQNPDTVITLVNGEKILVQEPVGEVVSRVVEFRRRLMAGAATLGHTTPLVLTRSANPTTNESEG